MTHCVPGLSHSSIPDSISKDIEKRCQSIYPLHDVFIRKVKVLKKPKFDSKLLTSCLLSWHSFE